MTKMDQLLFLEQFIAMWDLSMNYNNPPLQQQLTDLLTVFSNDNNLPLISADELFILVKDQIHEDEK